MKIKIHAMNRKMALNFTGSMAVWLCCCLLEAACEDNVSVSTPSERGQEISLSFNVAVDDVKDAQDVPATRGVNTHDTEKFPDTGNLTAFQPKAGMFITTAAGEEVFPYSTRMKVTSQLDGNALSFYAPSETDINNTLKPKGFTGNMIRVAAYWPWNEGATSIDAGVPFDFTTINSADKKQQDLLYFGKRDVTVPTTGSITLTFKHAFCRVKIKVKKYEDKDNVRLTLVGINNLSGEWIKNKGNIDLMTGYPKTGGNPGALLESVNATLVYDSYVTYEFLVPAFMSPDVKDKAVMFQMMIDGKIKLFPLNREHLNSATREGQTYYGFEQGCVNTYEVAYDNSAMQLRLINWNTLSPEGAFGERPVDNAGILMIDMKLSTSLNWGRYPTKGLAAKGTYQDYLSTVALGNNGSYVDGNKPFESDYTPYGDPTYNIPFPGDKNVYSEEKPVRCYVSTQDITSLPVAWEGKDGELIAKELCRNFRGGGFATWRLPRASELRMVAASYSRDNHTYSQFNLKAVDGVAGPYWAATEVNASQAWVVSMKDNSVIPLKQVILEKYDKKVATAKVRCVRDYQD